MTNVTMFTYIAPNNINNKNDLKDGDIVTLRNGDRLLYDNNSFTDLGNEWHNNLSDLCNLNDNMTMEDRDDKDSDIMKVERPIKYHTIFERDETVREMTVEEISEALGYEVKIVKEDK